MHDLDHTLTEAELEAADFELEGLELEDDEFEDFDEEEDGAEELGDSEEMELAAELLEANSEAELDMFLGKLVRRVAKRARRGLRRVSRGIRSRARGFVKRGLRKLARRGLGMAGAGLGGVVGGPVGALVGRKLARGAGRLFGLELEGMSPEDQEFEAARRFVRLAQDALNEVENADESQEPQEVARKALVRSAQRHAPGLVRKSSGAARADLPRGRASSGRWVRRGSSVILLGL